MRGMMIIAGLLLVVMVAVGCVPVAEVEAMKQKWSQDKAAYESRIAALQRENSRVRGDFANAQDTLRSREEELARQRQALDRYNKRTPGVKWFRDGNNIVVRMPNKILFDSGKAILKTTYLDTLKTIGKIINKDFAAGNIRVEGHTDNVPIVRNKHIYPSNWELSCHRACTVAKFLISKGYASPKQLYAAGFGEYRPIASNATRDGKAKNRRVEIVILPPKPGEKNASARQAAPQPKARNLAGPVDVVTNDDTVILK